MSDLMQEHLGLVAERLKAKGLSRIELQMEAEQRLTAATDSNLSTQARALATAEHKMITGLLAEATPTPLTPAEQAEKYRDEGKLVLAETLEHGIRTQAKRDELDTAITDMAATEDERTIERLGTKVESLTDTVNDMAHAPYHQRLIESQRIRNESADTMAAAGRQHQGGDITTEQLATIEAEATQTAIAARESVESGAA